jgi:peroxiredoxin Q/BCP
VEENKAFAEKFGYTFPLLCDTDKTVGTLYGAANSDFPARISYIIDENGKITHTLAKVDVKSHTNEVLTMLG